MGSAFSNHFRYSPREGWFGSILLHVFWGEFGLAVFIQVAINIGFGRVNVVVGSIVAFRAVEQGGDVREWFALTLSLSLDDLASNLFW